MAQVTATRKRVVHEYVTTRRPRIDEAAGVLYAVKFLGRKSRNRRTYPAQVIRRRVKLYEGAQVYANHNLKADKSRKARPVEAWAGTLRNVREEGGEGYADLHVNLATPAGRMLLDLARKAGDSFGLSPAHVIESTTGPDGWETVTDIVEVISVDFVSKPASTKNLWESHMTDEVDLVEQGPAVPPAPSLEDACKVMEGAIMATDADESEKLAMLKDFWKFKGKMLGTGDDGGDGEDGATEESVTTPAEAQTQQATPAPAPLRGQRLFTAKMERRQICTEEEYRYTEAELDQFLTVPLDQFRTYVQGLKRQARRPYRSSTPVSGQRRAPALEGQGGRAGTPPPPGATPDQIAAYLMQRRSQRGQQP